MAFGEGLHNAQASGGKRRTQLYALAGLGALVVVFLVIRSRSGASSGGYTSADLQNAAAQQAQADQAAGGGVPGTPSTFADNGASAGQLATDITAALGGEQTSIDNLTQAVQALQPSGSVQTTAATTDATPTPAPPPVDVTVNVTGPGVRGSPARSQKAKNAGRRSGGGTRSTGTKKTVVKGSHGTSSHHAGGTKRHGHAKKKR